MFEIVKGNIKNFLDTTVFLTMIAIGVFSILSDYRYFKSAGIKGDAAWALGIGLTFLLLPFAFLIIIRF